MAGQMGKVIVVGISGTTNSGKSTLARELAKLLRPNSTVMGQDAYFMPPGDPRLEPLYIPELDHHNWEDHRALEMDRMVDDVKKLISRMQNSSQDTFYLFIEGYSIYGWSPLAKLFDHKFFLQVDKETCWERRQLRNYNPPDVPGYFEKCVWPMHLKHLKLIEDQDDIEYIESNESMEEKIARIFNNIKRQEQSIPT